MVPISDGLHLSAAHDGGETAQNVVKSRLFYRLFLHLVRLLERANSSEVWAVFVVPQS